MVLEFGIVSVNLEIAWGSSPSIIYFIDSNIGYSYQIHNLVEVL